MNPNYSYQTSFPSFLENKANSKENQCQKVLDAIKKGADNLLKISETTGILQAIVSARVNDLREEKKVDYKDFVIYKNRKRKRISITENKKPA